VNVVIDMNLSPEWERIFSDYCEIKHWSRIGNPDTPDELILQWAKEGGHVILTNGTANGVSPRFHDFRKLPSVDGDSLFLVGTAVLRSWFLVGAWDAVFLVGTAVLGSWFVVLGLAPVRRWSGALTGEKIKSNNCWKMKAIC